MCRVGWGKTPTVSILSCSYILPTPGKHVVHQTLDITWHYYTLPLCYTPYLFIFVVEMQKYKKSSGRSGTHHGVKRLLAGVKRP